MNGSTSLTESIGVVRRCENLMQMLLALCVAAFQDVFTRFLALFDVVQRHNKFVKSLMQQAVARPKVQLRAQRVSRAEGTGRKACGGYNTRAERHVIGGF